MSSLLGFDVTDKTGNQEPVDHVCNTTLKFCCTNMACFFDMKTRLKRDLGVRVEADVNEECVLKFRSLPRSCLGRSVSEAGSSIPRATTSKSVKWSNPW